MSTDIVDNDRNWDADQFDKEDCSHSDTDAPSQPA